MQVLVLYEKHGDDYLAVPDGKEGEVILHVIRIRNHVGWYEGSMDDKEKLELRKALLGRLDAAIRFFRMRKNGEYEGWEIVAPREVL